MTEAKAARSSASNILRRRVIEELTIISSPRDTRESFMNSQPEDLILLVGSNPLPNYLAAKLLRPQRVHLIFTEETKAVRRRLRECLRGSGVEIVERSEYQLGDAIDAQMIRRITSHLPEGAGLNYTGGTKTMAAHVHAEWLASRGGKDSFASYLDDRGGQLRFDDGTTEPLQVPLDLDTLCKLHGLNHETRAEAPGGPSADEIVTLARALTEPPERAANLYQRLNPEGKKLKPAKLKDKPLTRGELEGVGCGSLPAPLPAPDWPNKRVERWIDVLSGEWLEEYVALLVRDLGLSDATVHVGVQAWDEESHRREDGCNFEVDVLVLRGHRLYAISCTTESANAGLCKSKLFEVALRARQLGGDLTRFAFVCLLGQTGQGEEKSAILERQARSAWDAPNKPRVFGLSHVRNWLAGNTSDLREWLES
jgi:hypothetical protein